MIHNPDILPAAASPPKEEAGARPTPASSPTLSVVMIVKDEEENLPRCLESLGGLGHDQLVVVDTGSTDRTMEIAREFGAEVYEHVIEPWDFALARNCANAYATSDWILALDADDTLVGAGQVKDILPKVPENIGAAAVLIEDMQGDSIALTFSQVRFCRRDRNPVWEGAYHNTLKYKGALALLEGVRIRHWGYDLSPEAMERKLQRTEEIIRRELQEGPGEAHRAYFYLAHISAKRDDHDGALVHGRKYVANARSHPRFNPAIYNVLFHCCLQLGEHEEAGKWLEMADEDIPEDLDIAYDWVLYGEWMRRPDWIIDGARKYLALYDAFKSNLATLATRFVYHYCPRSKAYVLRKAASTLASEASGALDQYKRVLAELPEQTAAAEREKAETDLQEAGTRWINP